MSNLYTALLFALSLARGQCSVSVLHCPFARTGLAFPAFIGRESYD